MPHLYASVCMVHSLTFALLVIQLSFDALIFAFCRRNVCREGNRKSAWPHSCQHQNGLWNQSRMKHFRRLSSWLMQHSMQMAMHTTCSKSENASHWPGKGFIKRLTSFRVCIEILGPLVFAIFMPDLTGSILLSSCSSVIEVTGLIAATVSTAKSQKYDLVIFDAMRIDRWVIWLRRKRPFNNWYKQGASVRPKVWKSQKFSSSDSTDRLRLRLRLKEKHFQINLCSGVWFSLIPSGTWISRSSVSVLATKYSRPARNWSKIKKFHRKLCLGLVLSAARSLWSRPRPWQRPAADADR